MSGCVVEAEAGQLAHVPQAPVERLMKWRHPRRARNAAAKATIKMAMTSCME
jgi:hypothetical protein